MSKCQRKDCEKSSTLQCPKCVTLRLPPAYFCSQECFRAAWPTHKDEHTVKNLSVLQAMLNEASSQESKFGGFSFTGKLRPGKVSPMSVVPANIAKPDYADDGEPVSERKSRNSSNIVIHTPQQIEKIKKCCKLAREVLDIAGKSVRVGITTDEIDKIVFNACIERNSYPSPLNYRNFPKSCCTSVNEVICHGIPDDRKLEDGDIVNIDISLYHDGVHSDVNETFLVGNVDENGRKLVRVSREALEHAIAAVKPGFLYRDVGGVIAKHVHANGFSIDRTYCGHGINELFHTAPNIPHYAKNKAVGVMKAGHIFTIEPMINEGINGTEHWPDNWTAVTKDGKRSAQFEHTLLVTETGCEVPIVWNASLSSVISTFEDRQLNVKSPAYPELSVIKPSVNIHTFGADDDMPALISTDEEDDGPPVKKPPVKATAKTAPVKAAVKTANVPRATPVSTSAKPTTNPKSTPPVVSKTVNNENKGKVTETAKTNSKAPPTTKAPEKSSAPPAANKPTPAPAPIPNKTNATEAKKYRPGKLGPPVKWSGPLPPLPHLVLTDSSEDGSLSNYDGSTVSEDSEWEVPDLLDSSDQDLPALVESGDESEGFSEEEPVMKKVKRPEVSTKAKASNNPFPNAKQGTKPKAPPPEDDDDEPPPLADSSEDEEDHQCKKTNPVTSDRDKPSVSTAKPPVKSAAQATPSVQQPTVKTHTPAPTPTPPVTDNKIKLEANKNKSESDNKPRFEFVSPEKASAIQFPAMTATKDTSGKTTTTPTSTASTTTKKVESDEDVPSLVASDEGSSGEDEDDIKLPVLIDSTTDEEANEVTPNEKQETPPPAPNKVPSTQTTTSQNVTTPPTNVTTSVTAPTTNTTTNITAPTNITTPSTSVTAPPTNSTRPDTLTSEAPPVKSDAPVESVQEASDDEPPMLISSEEEEVKRNTFRAPDSEDDEIPALVSSSDEEESQAQKENKETAIKEPIVLSRHLEDILDDELIEMDVTEMVVKAAEDQRIVALQEKMREAKLNEAEQYKQAANELLQEEKYTLALKYYTKAIECNPKKAIYWSNRAWTHIKECNYGAAISDATHALLLDESYVKSNYRRALALMEVDRHRDAITDLLLVIAENPDDKTAIGKLRQCEEHIKKTTFGRAIATLEAKKRPPPPYAVKTMSPGTWFDGGVLKLRCLVGRYMAKEAERDLNAVAPLLRDLPSGYYTMAIMDDLRENNLMKMESDYYRRLFAQKRDDPLLRDPTLNMIDVHDNLDLFYLETDPDFDNIPRLLCKRTNRRKFTPSPGVNTSPQSQMAELSIVDRDAFISNFNLFTEGQLTKLNWNNVLVAGGSVMACLAPAPPGNLKSYYHSYAYRSSDIDMFIYGLSVQEANAKLLEIYSQLTNNSVSGSVAFRSKHTITIASGYPQRHIQIVLRLYKSPAEVLMGFDVDSCAVGFDGVKVWMDPRCARALKYEINLIDLTRRSPSYEYRLHKYAKRGFSVGVPGLDMGKVQAKIPYYPTGLARLLSLDRGTLWDRMYTTKMDHDKQREKEMVKFNTKSISDYSLIHIPYGPNWGTEGITNYVASLNDRADDWYYRMVTCQPPRASGITFCSYGTMEQAIDRPISNSAEVETQRWEDDTSTIVLKEITKHNMWLTENPGRQGLLSGSFYPSTDDQADWEKGVYESIDSGKT
ncbi:hypothetical protein PROFUN_10432 [Planoprotostelium fungivorum]|uniref:Methionine aminopeptidase n=1 Tax=Planoprotostelium fungivorum TaxID=1890364 RepID=A0A2P6NE02_9EUKA|nr:hypothetical protein PROFUN_10432 [Planoprotostelium fungivorum]